MKRAVLLYFDQIFSTRKHLQLANCNVIPIKESPNNGCDIFRNRVMYFLYQPAGICQMHFIRFKFLYQLAQNALLTISIISITMFMVCVNVYYVYLLESMYYLYIIISTHFTSVGRRVWWYKGGNQNP